ncbi:hypothetical protein BDZ90DRAFT_231861 [Jaminaea rosea]|uniref:CRAL-TRIO domain-containing protein n=1 Tax=Jaminaea rosea TaxID=1569628 RepID=A0A316US04_9BASI|nr:hypothetical protein BDZ90DRAFT_231861 [Jaminaea rosea]PWN28100.1 hypothetical protein BDZ90DRAFT_231861 [Jaminaea rosea]
MSLGREATQVRSRDSVASSKKGATMHGSSKLSQRPSLLSRAYNSMSTRGQKGKESFKETIAKVSSHEDAPSETTAASDPTPAPKSFAGVFHSPEPGCRPKPPAKLTPDQEEKLAEMLKYFRAKDTYPTSLKDPQAEEKAPTEWEKLRMLSRESMLRYLRATKWDLAQAKKRLTDTIAWRREFRVDQLDPNVVEPEARSGKETVLGFDNNARPLHYMHPHRNDTKETPRQMEFAVWILERCIDLMPPGVEQLALLINFDHKSRNPTSISNAKLMLYILQNHYVERLGVALCINVPWVFKAFWSAIQPFIDPVTKSKCKFDEGIKSEVPAAQLSAEYGGDVDPKYNHDAYWPKLVEQCDEIRAKQLKRFKEQCNSEIGASEWVIRGGNDKDSTEQMGKKDIEDIAQEAEDKAALARTQSNAPAEAPTTQISDPAAARQEAIAASKERAEAGKAGKAGVAPVTLPNGHSDDTPADFNQGTADTAVTPSEAFKTPSANVNKNPIDRHFSALNAAPIGTGAACVAGAGAAGSAAGDPAVATNGDKPAATMSSAEPQEHHSDFKTAMNKIFHPDNQHGHDHEKGSTITNGDTTNGASAEARSVTLLLFAAARDAAGRSTMRLDLPSSPSPFPLKDLASLLEAQGSKDKDAEKVKDLPRLQDVLKRSQWSVGQSMVDEDEVDKTMLRGGEEVAVIPPVSGG